jgi:hypothetical protein
VSSRRPAGKGRDWAKGPFAARIALAWLFRSGSYVIMPMTWLEDVSMRLLCALVLASSLWVLPVALGDGGAAAVVALIRSPSVSERQLVLEAKLLCGMTDGRFGCQQAPGDVQHGKNATPGTSGETTPDATPQGVTGEQSAPQPAAGTNGAGTPGQDAQIAKPGEHSCPPGYRVLAVPKDFGYCEPPEGTADAAATACQHGMVGTPPADCHCPRNSELLGGNCVHYNATCHSGLPAASAPEPCPGAEEKLACKMRPDGLKDCCCLTYDKL